MGSKTSLKFSLKLPFFFSHSSQIGFFSPPECQQTSSKNTTLNQNHFILTLAGGNPRGAAQLRPFILLSLHPFFFFPVSSQAEQQKKAAVISAEGDSKAAELIANSLATAGDGLIELRKLEAAEDIAYQLSRSRNITYLPSGQSVLLQLPQ